MSQTRRLAAILAADVRGSVYGSRGVNGEADREWPGSTPTQPIIDPVSNDALGAKPKARRPQAELPLSADTGKRTSR